MQISLQAKIPVLTDNKTAGTLCLLSLQSQNSLKRVTDPHEVPQHGKLYLGHWLAEKSHRGKQPPLVCMLGKYHVMCLIQAPYGINRYTDTDLLSF